MFLQFFIDALIKLLAFAPNNTHAHTPTPEDDSSICIRLPSGGLFFFAFSDFFFIIFGTTWKLV